jgi:hydrogenase maturation protease
MSRDGRPVRPAPRLPVVIGCGNEHRQDDGVGRAVARALRPLLAGDARVVESDGEATGLLDLWEGEELVVVVDAVQSGSPPGTVRRMEVGDRALPAPLGASSTHSLSLAQGIELGRSLGRLPKRLVIYAVEAERLAIGVGLSPAVARSLPEVISKVEDEVRPARGAE